MQITCQRICVNGEYHSASIPLANTSFNSFILDLEIFLCMKYSEDVKIENVELTYNDTSNDPTECLYTPKTITTLTRSNYKSIVFSIAPSAFDFCLYIKTDRPLKQQIDSNSSNKTTPSTEMEKQMTNMQNTITQLLQMVLTLQNSLKSTSQNDDPPIWFNKHMTQFKQDLLKEVKTTFEQKVTEPVILQQTNNADEKSSHSKDNLISESGKQKKITEGVDVNTLDPAKNIVNDEKDANEQGGFADCADLDVRELRDNQKTLYLKAEPGQYFSFVWNVVNCGTQTWPSDIELRSYSNNIHLQYRSLPQLAPGQTGQIFVQCSSPTQTGSYGGFWRLTHLDQEFGECLAIELRVLRQGESERYLKSFSSFCKVNYGDIELLKPDGSYVLFAYPQGDLDVLQRNKECNSVNTEYEESSCDDASSDDFVKLPGCFQLDKTPQSLDAWEWSQNGPGLYKTADNESINISRQHALSSSLDTLNDSSPPDSLPQSFKVAASPSTNSMQQNLTKNMSPSLQQTQNERVTAESSDPQQTCNNVDISQPLVQILSPVLIETASRLACAMLQGGVRNEKSSSSFQMPNNSVPQDGKMTPRTPHLLENLKTFVNPAGYSETEDNPCQTERNLLSHLSQQESSHNTFAHYPQSRQVEEFENGKSTHDTFVQYPQARPPNKDIKVHQVSSDIGQTCSSSSSVNGKNAKPWHSMFSHSKKRHHSKKINQTQCEDHSRTQMYSPRNSSVLYPKTNTSHDTGRPEDKHEAPRLVGESMVEEMMEVLVDMGFCDVPLNMKVLRYCNFDLEDAIHLFLKQSRSNLL